MQVIQVLHLCQVNNINSMSVCSLNNCAMQETTGVTFMSSEQHKLHVFVFLK